MGILSIEMIRLVREQKLGFVATVCPDGTPNLSPKGALRDYDEDHLVFADIRSPGTVRNLAGNSAVEINVVDALSRKGYRFKGTGEVVEDGPALERAVALLRSIGVASAIDRVVLVRVTRVGPLVSPAYDGGATESAVRTRWRRYWESLWSGLGSRLPDASDSSPDHLTSRLIRPIRGVSASGPSAQESGGRAAHAARSLSSTAARDLYGVAGAMESGSVHLSWWRDGYELSTDPQRIDLALVHRFLSGESYWSPGIPRRVVERAVEHSLVFGLYHADEQVGFARVVTDRATFAYLADVFVLPAHRGQGLSAWMMESIIAHPDLQALRRWMLATRDAHGLYQKFGFEPLGTRAGMFMERYDPHVYGRAPGDDEGA